MLQKTGAFISQGGTTLTPGSTALLTQPSDLSVLRPPSLTLGTLSWASAYGGQVSGSTTLPHGVPTGKEFNADIAGVIPGGYNGAHKAMSTGPSAFVYYLPVNPGVQTLAGVMLPPMTSELQTMSDTFFAQGGAQSVYVIELGPGTVAEGTDFLRTFLTENDQFFYSYLVPRSWDADPSFLALIADYESTTAKTYFFVTTTLNTMKAYDETMKDVIAMVEAPQYGAWAQNAAVSGTWSSGAMALEMTSNTGVKPGDWFTLSGFVPLQLNGIKQALPGTTGTALSFSVPLDPGTITTPGFLQRSVYSSPGAPATEFTLAAPFYVSLNYDPSDTNRVTPYCFAFLFGVTMFPTLGNKSVLSAMQAGNINYVGSGAEGGISDRILLWGHTMDGRPFNYWYSVDWMQINIDLFLSNAIINGSNNPINPLYYNQQGIDRLEQVAASVGSAAISFGLAIGSVIQLGLEQQAFNNNLNKGQYNGNVVINAVPFVPYVTHAPQDYKIGKYAGFSMIYTPQRGFEHIIYNIVVTDFIGAAI
jgi:hypothetical protein